MTTLLKKVFWGVSSYRFFQMLFVSRLKSMMTLVTSDPKSEDYKVAKTRIQTPEFPSAVTISAESKAPAEIKGEYVKQTGSSDQTTWYAKNGTPSYFLFHSGEASGGKWTLYKGTGTAGPHGEKEAQTQITCPNTNEGCGDPMRFPMNGWVDADQELVNVSTEDSPRLVSEVKALVDEGGSKAYRAAKAAVALLTPPNSGSTRPVVVELGDKITKLKRKVHTYNFCRAQGVPLGVTATPFGTQTSAARFVTVVNVHGVLDDSESRKNPRGSAYWYGWKKHVRVLSVAGKELGLTQKPYTIPQVWGSLTAHTYPGEMRAIEIEETKKKKETAIMSWPKDVSVDQKCLPCLLGPCDKKQEICTWTTSSSTEQAPSKDVREIYKDVVDAGPAQSPPGAMMWKEFSLNLKEFSGSLGLTLEDWNGGPNEGGAKVAPDGITPFATSAGSEKHVTWAWDRGLRPVDIIAEVQASSMFHKSWEIPTGKADAMSKLQAGKGVKIHRFVTADEVAVMEAQEWKVLSAPKLKVARIVNLSMYAVEYVLSSYSSPRTKTP